MNIDEDAFIVQYKQQLIDFLQAQQQELTPTLMSAFNMRNNIESMKVEDLDWSMINDQISDMKEPILRLYNTQEDSLFYNVDETEKQYVNKAKQEWKEIVKRLEENVKKHCNIMEEKNDLSDIDIIRTILNADLLKTFRRYVKYNCMNQKADEKISIHHDDFMNALLSVIGLHAYQISSNMLYEPTMTGCYNDNYFKRLPKQKFEEIFNCMRFTVPNLQLQKKQRARKLNSLDDVVSNILKTYHTSNTILSLDVETLKTQVTEKVLKMLNNTLFTNVKPPMPVAHVVVSKLLQLPLAVHLTRLEEKEVDIVDSLLSKLTNGNTDDILVCMDRGSLNLEEAEHLIKQGFTVLGTSKHNDNIKKIIKNLPLSLRSNNFYMTSKKVSRQIEDDHHNKRRVCELFVGLYQNRNNNVGAFISNLPSISENIMSATVNPKETSLNFYFSNDHKEMEKSNYLINKWKIYWVRELTQRQNTLLCDIMSSYMLTFVTARVSLMKLFKDSYNILGEIDDDGNVVVFHDESKHFNDNIANNNIIVKLNKKIFNFIGLNGMNDKLYLNGSKPKDKLKEELSMMTLNALKTHIRNLKGYYRLGNDVMNNKGLVLCESKDDLINDILTFQMLNEEDRFGEIERDLNTIIFDSFFDKQSKEVPYVERQNKEKVSSELLSKFIDEYSGELIKIKSIHDVGVICKRDKSYSGTLLDAIMTITNGDGTGLRLACGQYKTRLSSDKINKITNIATKHKFYHVSCEDSILTELVDKIDLHQSMHNVAIAFNDIIKLNDTDDNNLYDTFSILHVEAVVGEIKYIVMIDYKKSWLKRYCGFLKYIKDNYVSYIEMEKNDDKIIEVEKNKNNIQFLKELPENSRSSCIDIKTAWAQYLLRRAILRKIIIAKQPLPSVVSFQPLFAQFWNALKNDKNIYSRSFSNSNHNLTDLDQNCYIRMFMILLLFIHRLISYYRNRDHIDNLKTMQDLINIRSNFKSFRSFLFELRNIWDDLTNITRQGTKTNEKGLADVVNTNVDSMLKCWTDYMRKLDWSNNTTRNIAKTKYYSTQQGIAIRTGSTMNNGLIDFSHKKFKHEIVKEDSKKRCFLCTQLRTRSYKSLKNIGGQTTFCCSICRVPLCIAGSRRNKYLKTQLGKKSCFDLFHSKEHTKELQIDDAIKELLGNSNSISINNNDNNSTTNNNNNDDDGVTVVHAIVDPMLESKNNTKTKNDSRNNGTDDEHNVNDKSKKKKS